MQQHPELTKIAADITAASVRALHGLAEKLKTTFPHDDPGETARKFRMYAARLQQNVMASAEQMFPEDFLELLRPAVAEAFELAAMTSMLTNDKN
ncbi:MAG: hypothetical protein WC505_05895 [Patescibacteria group bacterium]